MPGRARNAREGWRALEQLRAHPVDKSGTARRVDYPVSVRHDEFMATSSVDDALRARGDLDVYGDNKRLLFAVQMAFAIEDIQSVAEQALTDGQNDKKCDLVYVDSSTSRAVIAQAYEAAVPKRVAKANKASDLNTAVTWMLGQELDELPPSIAAAAKELHAALEADEITSLELWYVHNSPESEIVAEELKAAAKTARRLLNDRFGQAKVESVLWKEVGQSTLETWYRGTQVPIFVNEEFTLPISGYLMEAGDKWNAVCASVPASWLNELFRAHQSDLFSANVRGYLGSRQTNRNINYNIKETAQTQPGRFWAYNNGLTALVNEVSVSTDGASLTIKGIAIVNGAQTTGALGNVEASSLGDARVLARFVKCDDAAVIREITRYNNSQNKIEPADFRSNDSVQERLRREFEELGDVRYSGARRGGVADVIKRPGENMIPSSTAAQALAAFHRDPDLAYNQKSRIWESDQMYGRYFSDNTSAQHVLFSYSLLKAVEAAKRSLTAVPLKDRTQAQMRGLEFFGQRGSTFLLVAAIASCTEIYLDAVVADPFKLHFTASTTLTQAIQLWTPLVTPSLALNSALRGALERNLRAKERVTEALEQFEALFEATKDSNRETFETFAKRVVIN